jgi:hypothetical protein
MKNSHTLSPDMIVEQDGKRIGIEFKHEIVSGAVASGIGQLLFGKIAFGIEEMWLVFPKRHFKQTLSISWFKTLEYVGIIPFLLDESGFTKIEEKDCEQWGRVEWLKHHLKNSGKL